MAQTNSTSKEKATDKKPDSKFVSAVKAFATVATATAIPTAMLSVWVIPTFDVSTGPGVMHSGFTSVCTLFAALAGHTIADGKVGPKIEQGLSKKTVVAGLATGLAAAGLLSWQLHAGEAETKPVTSTQPASSLSLPKLAK